MRLMNYKSGIGQPQLRQVLPTRIIKLTKFIIQKSSHSVVYPKHLHLHLHDEAIRVYTRRRQPEKRNLTQQKQETPPSSDNFERMQDDTFFSPQSGTEKVTDYKPS